MGSALACFFTRIDLTGDIPEAWRKATIIPFFKAGRRDNPANYRPISLLSILGKLYARHLLEKLKSWLDQENPVVDEQARFMEGRFPMGHNLILSYLIDVA